MRKTRTFEFSTLSTEDVKKTHPTPAASALLESTDTEDDDKLQHEIDSRVAAEIAKQKKILSASMEIELAKREKEKFAELQAEKESLKVLTGSMESLLDNIASEYDAERARQSEDLSEAVIALVLESLYKISERAAVDKSVVESVVNNLIEKRSSESMLVLRVSTDDHRLLESLSNYNDIKSLLVTDTDLSAGQVVMEDGNSLYKVGLLDRLDVLRQAFIDALEKKNGL